MNRCPCLLQVWAETKEEQEDKGRASRIVFRRKMKRVEANSSLIFYQVLKQKKWV